MKIQIELDKANNNEKEEKEIQERLLKNKIKEIVLETLKEIFYN